MRIITFDAPIIVSKIDAHEKIKTSLIQTINNMGRFSFSTGNGKQKITHTDWHLGQTVKRPYWRIIEPYLLKLNQELCARLFYDQHKIVNSWFQWYEKGDFHEFHVHETAMFSNVYYLNLDDQNPKTTFVLNNQEFEIKINEGDVITFPSFLAHKSSVNLTDKTKIVIAFNSNFYRE